MDIDKEVLDDINEKGHTKSTNVNANNQLITNEIQNKVKTTFHKEADPTNVNKKKRKVSREAESRSEPEEENEVITQDNKIEEEKKITKKFGTKQPPIILHNIKVNFIAALLMNVINLLYGI